MLYNLVQIRGGKETIYMTDTRIKCMARKKVLLDSQRGKNHYYIIVSTEDTEKYRKPPNMNFDPSGDAGSRKYRNRKAKAKHLKKNNPKRKESEVI